MPTILPALLLLSVSAFAADAGSGVPAPPVAAAAVAAATPGNVPAAAVPDRQPADPPAVAPTTDDPAIEDALLLGKEIVKAARGGNWHIVMVSALMLLVWIGRKLVFMKRIPKEYMPWVAVGLSTLTVIAANLQAGWGWWKSISGGIVTGLAAAGFWELLGKYLLGGQKLKKAAPAA